MLYPPSYPGISKPSLVLDDFWENVSTVDGHRITGSYLLTTAYADGASRPASCVFRSLPMA